MLGRWRWEEAGIEEHGELQSGTLEESFIEEEEHGEGQGPPQ